MSRRVVDRLARPTSFICSQCIRRQTGSTLSRRAFQHSTRNQQGSDSSFLSVLEERGLINQIAGDRNALDSLLRKERLSMYAGIDPTAPSLHLGHLLPLMVLFWAAIHGHTALSLVGGGTARVGDPSGRLTARENPVTEVQQSNAAAMFAQTKSLWKSAMVYAERHGYGAEDFGEHRVLDNAQWLDKLNVLDFLKALGNGMRVGTMLGRDTVKNKMEKGDGMSFAEFTYPLLQGWDWWHMYSEMDVQIQVGGSDQYGNIVAGMDAVKYIAQNHQDHQKLPPPWLDKEGRLKEDFTPMGLTVPLLTTASGDKFGKSAGNAVWLDQRLTSPFDLYGFLLRSADADVERYLRLFTFVKMPKITALMSNHKTDPGKRHAQHKLALEVLTLVHGREVAESARQEHQAMRNPSLHSLSDQKESKTHGSQGTKGGSSGIILPQSEVLNKPFGKVLYSAGLVDSGSSGRKLVGTGAIYVASRGNSRSGDGLTFLRVQDQYRKVQRHTLIDGKLVIRVGKWKVRVIDVVPDEDSAAPKT